MIKKIVVEHLQIGMYVSQMDRSWMKTPFLSHKFEIKTPKQLSQLKESCDFVFIDTEKGKDAEPEGPKQETLAEAEGPGRRKKPLPEIKETPEIPGADEIRRSFEVRNQVKTVVKSLLEDVRMGQTIDTTQAKESVESAINSLINDQNALLCLTQLRSQDEYTVSHSINVCILSLAFGRHLKLSREQLGFLGLGTLLHDIGKMKIPLEILNKPGKLTDPEFEIMKSHVILGKEVMEATKDFPSEAMELLLQHHERISGKGYPYGLQGNQISLFGQIISIMDVYDAMTTNRVYRKATPPHEAIKMIYEGISTDFAKEMVENFIKTIGIFPIGSQVEINHADIGMVMSSNPENTLRPTVLLLYDSKRQRYRPPRMIDLTEKDLFSNKIKWSVTKVFGPIEEEQLAKLCL
jgi:putative nucleotidyltransferase with HDIG domain